MDEEGFSFSRGNADQPTVSRRYVLRSQQPDPKPPWADVM